MAAAAVVRGGIHHLASPKLTIETTSRSNRAARRCFVTRAADQDDHSDNQPNETEPESFNWDKAWASYQAVQNRKKKAKPLFDFDRFVSKSPVYRDYPLSEEVDGIRRDERSFLESWTDPRFTAAGFSVVVVLFVYMFMNAPPHA